jgi:PAS domain S-box-containing protein
MIRPIEREGKGLGTLFLEVSQQGLYDRVRLLGAIAAVVVVVSLLLAFALSASLQRLISGPILGLAAVAKRIAEHKDYTVRAPAQGRNEVGALTDAFNDMVGQIHGQNQALQDGEERLRAVLNAALSAVIVVDAAGIITDWNARAHTIFGLSREQAIGRELASTIFPERGRDPRQTGFPVVTGADDHDRAREVIARRSDGSEFPAELSVDSLRTGGQVAFCGFITDITERKQAEKKLQEQLGRLDLLARITHAISVRQDLPSIFQVVIRRVEEDLPVDVASVYLYDATTRTLAISNVGLHGEFLAHAADGAPTTASPADLNGLGKCIDGELIYEPDLAAHRSFPLLQRFVDQGFASLVASPLVVDSKIFAVLMVARRPGRGFSSAECEFLRQLSDHVALAAHQAQLYGALQQAYDDLRQTQQTVMQQERLRALGQMASGIAHDINNAISPVGLYAELLLQRESGLSPRGRKQLETINRAIDDVAHTVTRMGEFYRQREPQMQLAPVDANEMLRQVLDLTRVRWSDMPQQRGLMVQTLLDLATDLPPLMAIASEVREALTNLVFNAIDAMPNGGTLTLRTRAIDQTATSAASGSSRLVVIEVEDTGIGMNEETRRRCLEPFFTTKGERGTGLGLAMVYGVLQRHQADIEIDSVVGKGTTMRMRFPVRSSNRDAVSTTTLVPGTSLRILLVDDDPLILKSLRDALEADGHVVATANGGQAGIDAFRTSHQTGGTFAIVITDLGMPYVDGRRVASNVKAISPATPVIMLTGWGQRLIAEGDIPAHVDCVLSKPPKLHEVRAALARVCSGKQG